jgi:hypothetical protein
VFADVRASPTTEEVYLYSLAQRSSEKHKQKPNETTKHIHKIHSQIYNSDEHLPNILDNDNKHLIQQIAKYVLQNSQGNATNIYKTMQRLSARLHAPTITYIF